MVGILFKRSSIAGLENLKEVYLVKDENHNPVCVVDSIDLYDKLMESVSWWSDSDDVITDSIPLIENDDNAEYYSGNRYTLLIDDNDNIVDVIYDYTKNFSIVDGVNVGNVYNIFNVFEHNSEESDATVAVQVFVPEFLYKDGYTDDDLAIEVVKDFLGTYIDTASRMNKDNIKAYNDELVKDIIID
jgi:hypothetical protein